MSDKDKERPIPDPRDRKQLMKWVLDQAIGMLGPGPNARSKLVLVEDLLRNGQLTPDMRERWATVKAKVVELAANKELNDRARRRARLVLVRMENMAPPSS